jgi:hypothetical protein
MAVLLKELLNEAGLKLLEIDTYVSAYRLITCDGVFIGYWSLSEIIEGKLPYNPYVTDDIYLKRCAVAALDCLVISEVLLNR